MRELHEAKRYSITELCNMAGIRRSSYYKWNNRLESEADHENTVVLTAMIQLYTEVKGIYGYRRMTMNINRSLNKQYNHKRIYRLMKSVNMKSVIRKKKKNYMPSTLQITAENVLNREFQTDKPNQKWVTDVTEFKLTNGQKAYLSAILDLCDKSIVSYVLGRSNNNQLVFDTFDLAVAANPYAKPLFHSDRGFQYTNRQFKKRLDIINATQSMSRVGRCIDNGPMEGFWGIIKSEMYYLHKFHTYEELKQAIEKYIDFYNMRRLQKNLRGLAPMEYRNQTLVA
nr:IS3 family transposase [Ruminiclostridium hungatei]